MGSTGPGSGQKTAQGAADLLAQLGREEAPRGGNYFPVRVWENWEKQERKEGGHGVCNLAADSRTNKVIKDRFPLNNPFLNDLFFILLI